MAKARREEDDGQMHTVMMSGKNEPQLHLWNIIKSKIIWSPEYTEKSNKIITFQEIKKTG